MGLLGLASDALLDVDKVAFVKGNGKYLKPEDIIQVDYNPATLNISVSREVSPVYGTGGDSNSITTNPKDPQNNFKGVVQTNANNRSVYISGEFIFDVVDMYERATTEGLGGAIGFVKSLKEGATGPDDIHLYNEESNFMRLCDACTTLDYVTFAWGPIYYPVNITSFNATFTYFSKAGAPLRAKVYMNMRKITPPKEDEYAFGGLPKENMIKQALAKLKKEAKSSLLKF